LKQTLLAAKRIFMSSQLQQSK